MKTYTITAEKTSDNGKTWETWRLEVTGYLAALRVAKALAGANTGGILLRDNATGKGRIISC